MSGVQVTGTQVTGPALRIADLTVTVPGPDGPVAVVDGLDLEVGRGEIHGLAGESGSGKTMAMLSVLGLLPTGARASGSVRVGDTEVLTAGRRELQRLRGRRVAMVFQDPMTSLHPMLSVGVQLTEHVRHHLGLGRRAARDRAVELLTTVRIPDPPRALDSYPHQFSGGMRQRIAIASALACEPELLVADEPTTALDVTVQAGILRLLDRLRAERGTGVVLITHDLGVLSAVADRVTVLYAGRVAEHGGRDRVLGAPRHPYTRALLDALPQPQVPGRTLHPIGGGPPSPRDRPRGCPFHPRCGYAEDGCRTDRPAPELVGAAAPAHLVACPVDPLAPAPGAAGAAKEVAGR